MLSSKINDPEYDKIVRDIRRRHYQFKPGAKFLFYVIFGLLFCSGFIAIKNKNHNQKASEPPCQSIRADQ